MRVRSVTLSRPSYAQDVTRLRDESASPNGIASRKTPEELPKQSFGLPFRVPNSQAGINHRAKSLQWAGRPIRSLRGDK